MKLVSFAFLSGAVLAAPAAQAGTISVTLPRIDIAEYKRPYVAGWVEPAGGGAPRSLFVWYEVRKGDGGVKWLSDLRSWWRKAGRSMKLPADGVSGATRGPGTYKIALPADLKPGNYVVYVEAAREHGGRELLSVPVSVPAGSGRAAGKTELGAIVVSPR